MRTNRTRSCIAAVFRLCCSSVRLRCRLYSIAVGIFMCAIIYDLAVTVVVVVASAVVRVCIAIVLKRRALRVDGADVDGAHR